MINTGYLFHERRAVQCTCISAFYTLNLKKLKVLIMEKQKGQAFVIAHGCKYEYPSYICNMLTATLIGAQNMVSMWPVNIKLCQIITAPHPLWPWIIKFCVGFYLHVSHQEMGSGHGVLVKKNNLLRGFWNSVNQNYAICLAFWYRFLLSHVCEWSSSIAWCI